MLQRGGNENIPSAHRYSLRGITVCERWKHSFKNFFSDMGFRPSPEHSVGRKDNDKGYFPENCEWQTREEQNRNKENNKFITLNGVTKTIGDWSISLGMDRNGVTQRLAKGWSIERALTEVPNNRKDKFGLTDHQKNIIMDLCDEKTCPEIEKRFGLAEGSGKGLREKIYKVLGIHNIAQLVIWAAKAELIVC